MPNGNVGIGDYSSFGNGGVLPVQPEVTCDVNGEENIRVVNINDSAQWVLVWDPAQLGRVMRRSIDSFATGAENGAWLNTSGRVEWGTNPLLHNTEIPMIDAGSNEYNIYFTGQSQLLNEQADIGIGYDFNDPLAAKLDVRSETFSDLSLVAPFVNQHAGRFINDGTYTWPVANDVIGVRGESNVQSINSSTFDNSTNIGGDFVATGSDGLNYGMRAEATSTTGLNIGALSLAVTPNNNWSNLGLSVEAAHCDAPTGISAYSHDGNSQVMAGLFRASETFGNGNVIGVQASADGSSEGTYFGLIATANAGVPGTVASTAYGVFASAFGAPSGSNYAVYGDVANNAGDWAGFFVGDVQAGANYFPSDANLKLNSEDMNGENAMEILRQVRPKTYSYDTINYSSLSLPRGEQHGLIAQEVEEVLPQYVKQTTKPARRDSVGNVIEEAVSFKAINYNAFIPILIAAIKDLDSVKQKLESANSDLAERLDLLESALADLKDCCNRGDGVPQGSGQRVDLGDYAIILDQNSPNPFAEQTTIGYTIPTDVIDAKILFYDNNGRVLKSVTVTERGASSMIVYASNLSSGTYTYSLIADGKLIDTKKMNCQK